ncbi:MAG TPA: sigma-70 family RNA polymerase sigma factor, partial [Polyangiaceae bacterium]|nr:sigma-70 family RNA polymerase sigma factor [Polyangiaceae bacterium]
MNTGLPSPLEGQAIDDPALHAWLRSYVRRRVPSDEADDLVQAVLCAALEARQRPPDAAGLRRWLTGVARHLIARHYEGSRSARRSDDEAFEPAQAPPPFEERSLVRWAELQAEAIAHGPETLDWMAREGEGEKLESIAREAELPSARVRQRVSRLRRWMKGRYLAELALASTLAMALAWWWTRREDVSGPKVVDDAPTASPSVPTPAERAAAAAEQREAAARLCERRDWAGCLEALDAAKRIDPAGDLAPAIEGLRRAAAEATARELPTPPVKGKVLKVEPPSKEDAKSQAGRFGSEGTPSAAPPPSNAKKPGKVPTTPPPGSTGPQNLAPGSGLRALPKSA